MSEPRCPECGNPTVGESHYASCIKCNWKSHPPEADASPVEQEEHGDIAHQRWHDLQKYKATNARYATALKEIQDYVKGADDEWAEIVDALIAIAHTALKE